jgi:xanthine dehydrogenase YagT iron-sulfur-binding subunit
MDMLKPRFFPETFTTAQSLFHPGTLKNSNKYYMIGDSITLPCGNSQYFFLLTCEKDFLILIPNSAGSDSFLPFTVPILLFLSIFRRRNSMKTDRDRPEEKSGSRRGITRRKFLKTVGSSAAIAAASDALTGRGTAQAAVIKPEVIVRVNLFINGLRHSLVVEPRWSLLYVLREKLGLTGTKVGCERGECGACTVLMDDIPRYACLTLAVEAQEAEIVTLEGLMHAERLGAVQQAFVEHDAFQCGYCTPGQIMSAEGLLRSHPAPKPDEIRMAMSGNLCRCGAYANIYKAVGRAAELKGTKGGAS